MKDLFIIFLLISFISCDTNKEEKKLEDYSPEIQQRAREMTDSLIENSTKEALFDTAGISEAPVKVLSARLVKKEYSNYKDISLTFKNVSKKRIEAIRFRWYGLNAFGEPADMGSYGLARGFGSGFDDDPLAPGRSTTSTWSILSRDGKSVVLAWPYEIVFSDGSKWMCGKGN